MITGFSGAGGGQIPFEVVRLAGWLVGFSVSSIFVGSLWLACLGGNGWEPPHGSPWELASPAKEKSS